MVDMAALMVLAATLVASVKNRNEVCLFHRTVPAQTVKKCVAVTGMSLLIFFVSTALLAAVAEAPLTDILYETASATATVGLTRGLTPTLSLSGKLILIFTMFFGRVGPISLAVAFGVRKESENIVHNPTEPLSVG